MNLIESIHGHAQTRPDAPAIITPQRKISWSELDRLIWSTALKLSGYGLKAGDRVGITMAHPVIHLVTALGLARMGVAHIAIPASESDQARNELSTKLEVKAVISDLEKIVTATSNAVLLNRLAIANINAGQKESLKSTDGNLTWLILQSSGTTGKAKYSELSHRGALERLKRLASVYQWNIEDILWTAIRLDFTAAKQLFTYGLAAGVGLCLLPGRENFSDTVHFIHENKITLGYCIPSTLDKLIEMNQKLPNLKAMLAATSTVNVNLRRLFKEKICPNLIVGYGTNEASYLASTSPGIQEDDNGYVGQLGIGIEVSIVDKNDIDVKNEVTGEIKIRGPGIVNSYINNPEATAKSFKEGWFYPGDLGYLTKEGGLVLRGRKDDMMIFDGINIYPAEIENALSSHPAVREVAAFAVKHERFQDVPVAAVTLKEPVSEKQLIDFCKNTLGVKHPKRVFILKEFPRNPMGKILKRQLSSVVAKMSS